MSLFITFEGMEGCGKTTQIKLLQETLTQEGRDVLLTREPGGTATGQLIRKILLDRKNENMASLCELFLYAADRAQHIDEIIKPALNAGKIVLCDRFVDATTAYQEGGRELPEKLVSSINGLASAGLKPDLTFLIDCSVEVGLTRARQRAQREHDMEDRFERLEVLFHERVRKRYLKIAQDEKERFRIIDGSGDRVSIHQEILSHLQKALQTLKKK
ncbi:MAG: dTMP kinase [bacterium]